MTTIALPLVPFVSSNFLSESIIAQYTETGGDVVEKIRGLDVSMDDLLAVGRGESAEEGGEIGAEKWEGRGAVIGLLYSSVRLARERQEEGRTKDPLGNLDDD